MKKIWFSLILTIPLFAQQSLGTEEDVVVTADRDAQSLQELKKEVELIKKVYSQREAAMQKDIDSLRSKVEGDKKVAVKKKSDETPENLYDSVKEEQTTLYDFDQRFSVKSEKSPFEFDWSYNMLQEFHWWNNTDLRTLNTESDTEIAYTDDQMALALTRAKIDAEVTFPEERIGLELSWGFDGVWGHDQLQGYANPGTRIGRANVFWNYLAGSVVNSTLTIGRQYFSIGGISNDYMLKDVLDAVVIDAKWNKFLEARFLVLDVYSGANNYGSDDGEVWNDEFQYFTRDDGEQMGGLNGDVSTYRTGLVVSLKELVGMPSGMELDPRLYGFFANVRGNGGGADRSENGQIGNFSDNDWSAMGGGRASFSMSTLPLTKSLMVYADAAVSAGTDLKRDGEPTVSNLGFGGGMGAQATLAEMMGLVPFVEIDTFYATGPEYDQKGNLISHGFVSFKGDEIGGLLFRRYWGVHPSSYVDDDGIDNSPFSANRKSGTFMAHAGAGSEIAKKHTVRLDYWFSMDTGTAYLAEYGDYTYGSSGTYIDHVASENPYMSKAELEAQKRMGKILGHEINLGYIFEPNKLLSYSITGAVFMPGDFFEKPIEDAAATNGVPKGGASDAFFYGMAFGTELHF